MTRDKDRKRIIRTRMKKTGESYTAARAHILSTTRTPRAPEPEVDHSKLAGMADDKVAAKTGRTWREWTRVLDAAGAAALPHRDIARLVHDRYDTPDWWTQTVTVGYERIKGLRDRGQRRGGGYEASKSRTFDVPVRALFDAWSDAATRRRWLDGVNAIVRTARAPKSMRLQWPDGTVVVVGFLPKGNGRSVVAVQHTKLPDKPAADRSKLFWAERFDRLGAVLAAVL
jgi:hypothetical protein